MTYQTDRDLFGFGGFFLDTAGDMNAGIVV